MHHPSLRLSLLLAGWLTAAALSAQAQFALPLLEAPWQAHLANPAVVPDASFSIGGPALHALLQFDGPVYQDIITRPAGRPVLQTDRFIAALSPENRISSDLQVHTLGLTWRRNRLSFLLGHRLRFESFLSFPKTLPQVVWQGNAGFVGETIDVAPFVHAMDFHEAYAGAGYSFGILDLGVKVKWLSGNNLLATDRNHRSATLYTDPDVYQLTLRGDYLLHTARLPTYESLSDLERNFRQGNRSGNAPLGRNAGWALDLGFRLCLGRLDLLGSLLDVGYIRWDHQVTNYRATETFSYEGLDISGALSGDGVDFDRALDTIRQLWQVDQTHVPLRTRLSAGTTIGARWTFSPAWRAGVAYVGRRYPTAWTHTLLASVDARVVPALDMGIHLSFQEPFPPQAGLHATLHVGTVQLFCATNDIAGAVRPSRATTLSAFAGIALCFP